MHVYVNKLRNCIQSITHRKQQIVCVDRTHIAVIKQCGIVMHVTTLRGRICVFCDVTAVCISNLLTDLLSYLLTDLLTYSDHTAIILETLTSSEAVKKFPTFYGNRRFITAFTSARHLSIS